MSVNVAGVEIIHTASRREWLDARSRDITASKIAALIGPGVHPYCSPFRLWAEKTGRLASDDDLDSAALNRGRRLEGLAAEMAIEQLPPDSKAERNIANAYWRNTAARIGATPDLIVHNSRGKGVVQLKSVEPGIFAKTWIDGEPPLWIACQALTEAKLTGAEWAAVGVLRVGFGVDFDLIEIPLHQGAWDRLQSAAADFWRAVDEDRPLAPDYRVDGAVIAALHSGSNNGSTIDLSRDNEIVSGVIERDAYKNQTKAIEAELDRIDAMIRHKAGDNEIVLAGDYRVTLKTENVKAYTVAARTRRPIRVRRIHGAEAVE
jgi:predicted phage-related endonuclease